MSACRTAAFQQKLPGPGQTEIIGKEGILKRTQTGKGISTRTFCQKIQGIVKNKPLAMGDNTTCRSVPHERIPLQNGNDGQTHP
jgi:hypothetical protein